MASGAADFELPGVPDVWERVKAAPFRLMGVDYDGTLATFRVERMEATLPPGVRPALEALRDMPGTALVIVSGRPIEQLVALVGDIGVPMIGAHGWERRDPDGAITRIPPSATQQQGLHAAQVAAEAAHLGPYLEEKSASVALHLRAVPGRARIEATARSLWQPLLTAHALELRRFNHGLELRATGRNKGIAFQERFAALPAGTLPVYIGDDETDEDAFLAIQNSGIGIKVGTSGAGTAAPGRLADPAHVLRFLRAWLEVASVTREEP